MNDNRVINYFQSMVALEDPLEGNLDNLGTSVAATPIPTPTQPAISSPDELASEGATEPTIPASSTHSSDAITGVEVDVRGQLWWGGLTASLAVTNTSDQALENWGVEFISDHRFSGEAWGVNVSSERHEGGGYRYEISGADWGQSIAPGQTIDVGFNALTGITDNVNIPLTEQLLLAEGSITIL